MSGRDSALYEPEGTMPETAVRSREEWRNFFVAAMTEAGFPDIAIHDDGKTWSHPRINDEDVRLAAFRALFLAQRIGNKLRQCWDCFRVLPTGTRATEWQPCEHPVVWR